MARPPKYNDQIRDALIDGVSAGLTNKDAALCAGIDETTLTRWVKRYADLADRLSHARAKRSRDLLAAIQAIGAKDRDWRALAEVLDRTAPEYRKVHKSEATVTLDIRKAAEQVAADLGVPVDTVLAETYRMVEDGAG